MSYIILNNIWKKFDKNWVLKNLNLKIKKEEIFGIFGPSGCGKTTLLRIITGLEKPDKGKVVLRDKIVCNRKTFVPPEDRNVSLIFQDLALWPHLTVEEHLKFVTTNEEKIERILKELGLLKLKDLRPYQLSQGQKQKVAIARALVKETDILLLDEPFSSLDLKSKAQIKNLLKGLQKKKGLTLIYVTHDISDLMDLCERVGWMENGRIRKIERTKNFVKKFKDFIRCKS